MSELDENTGGIVFTDADFAAALDVLSQCPSEGLLDIFTLTDEEIVTLDGRNHAQIVPTPWLDAHADADIDLLGEVIMRSLQSRGLAIAVNVGAPGEEDDIALDVQTDIRGVLTLRRTATDIAAIQLTTADVSHWIFGYGHQDNKTLVETISANGQHSFDICPDANLLTRILELTQLGESIGMDRPAEEFSEAQFQNTDAPPAHLDEAIAIVSLAAVGVGADEKADLEIGGSVNFFVGPTWVRQVSESHEGSEMRTVREVSSTTIEASVRSILKASAPPVNPTASW